MTPASEAPGAWWLLTFRDAADALIGFAVVQGTDGQSCIGSLAEMDFGTKYPAAQQAKEMDFTAFRRESGTPPAGAINRLIATERELIAALSNRRPRHHAATR